jgi:hypothetical protein
MKINNFSSGNKLKAAAEIIKCYSYQYVACHKSGRLDFDESSFFFDQIHEFYHRLKHY